MEINFKNRQELKKYLDYLEGIKTYAIDIPNYFDRENLKEMFLDDMLDSSFTHIYCSEDNEYISKLLWGVWIEDGESFLDYIYDYSYSTWYIYTQCFEKCFTTNWEEEKIERETLEKEYESDMEELKRKYNDKLKALDKRYKENC